MNDWTRSLDSKMGHHSKSKPYLALAPGPLAPGPTHTLPMQTSIAVDRPKKNSTACLACKTAKRKCSGPPSPCKACLSTGSEKDCHFDPSRDLRRKVAVKRTIQELSDYKDLLDSLLSTLRFAPPEKVQETIGLIQQNASMRDVAYAVGCPITNFADSRALSNSSQMSISEDGEPGLESPLSENFKNKVRRPSEISLVSTSPERDHHTDAPELVSDPYVRVSLESLCDIPLYQVAASPWTKVTDDDSLVSHLVSLYFTWEHPCAQLLDQGIFIEHMKRGDVTVESDFCTPLLVNSLLSMASTYSDNLRIYSHREKTSSRGDAFFAEAESLWKAQEGRSSLPNIQSLLMMCCVLSCQGKANAGWLMLQQAVQMARDIGLLMLPEAPNSKHMFKYDTTPDMERVRTITAWGISSLNGQMSMKLKKLGSLSQPALEADIGSHDFDWTPYPRSNQVTYTTKRARLPEVRRSHAELTGIILHIERLRYDEELSSDFDLLMARAEAPYHQLQNWLAAWPTMSQMGKEPVSQILTLRIKCLHVIMHLIELLIERDHQSSKSVQLQHTWLAQAEEIAQCLRLHRQVYGTKYIPSQIVCTVQAALRFLVHRLEGPNETQEVFIEICRFGVALGQKFKSVAETMQNIQSLVAQNLVRIPRQAEVILSGFE